MIMEYCGWRIVTNMADAVVLKVLTQYLLEGTEENKEHLSQDSRSPDRILVTGE